MVNGIDLGELYLNGMSIPDIAQDISLPMSAVRDLLIKLGIPLRSRADGVRLAALCITSTETGQITIHQISF